MKKTEPPTHKRKASFESASPEAQDQGAQGLWSEAYSLYAAGPAGRRATQSLGFRRSRPRHRSRLNQRTESPAARIARTAAAPAKSAVISVSCFSMTRREVSVW